MAMSKRWWLSIPVFFQEFHVYATCLYCFTYSWRKPVSSTPTATHTNTIRNLLKPPSSQRNIGGEQLLPFLGTQLSLPWEEERCIWLLRKWQPDTYPFMFLMEQDSFTGRSLLRHETLPLTLRLNRLLRSRAHPCGLSKKLLYALIHPLMSLKI